MSFIRRKVKMAARARADSIAMPEQIPHRISDSACLQIPCLPSPQKPERHKNAAFAKNGPKFHVGRNDLPPDFKSLAKAVENSPGVPKQ
jgi:hypothetical protein